jgi:hypothetical protein
VAEKNPLGILTQVNLRIGVEELAQVAPGIQDAAHLLALAA